MNKWMNEQMNYEWMNKWMMNEWISSYAHDLSIKLSFLNGLPLTVLLHVIDTFFAVGPANTFLVEISKIQLQN